MDKVARVTETVAPSYPAEVFLVAIPPQPPPSQPPSPQTSVFSVIYVFKRLLNIL